MTTEQQTQLNALTLDLAAKQNAVNIELKDNDTARYGYSQSKSLPSPGNFQWNGQAGNVTFWYNWLIGSDASLAAKKTQLTAAENALNQFKAMIALNDASAQSAALAANPQLLADIEKAKVNAEANKEAVKLTAAAESDKANYASKNVKYIVIGLVVIIIIFGVWFFKFRKKKGA